MADENRKDRQTQGAGGRRQQSSQQQSTEQPQGSDEQTRKALDAAKPVGAGEVEPALVEPEGARE